MKFSQRIGKTPVRNALQLDDIDVTLKNRLWNCIAEDFLNNINISTNGYQKSDKTEFCEFLWKEFFELPIDEIPSDTSWSIQPTVDIRGVIARLRTWYFKAQWFEIYDLIEFLSRIDGVLKTGFVEKCNNVLEGGSSGYRVIDSYITPITSDQEIEEIEHALQINHGWKPVTEHLESALAFFSNRHAPDYRNSIKESISAVEALCVIITGDKDGTLGQALDSIEKTWKIHGALKKAFSSLYGYTSDAGGIRHALLEGDTKIASEDARFMLVACSAFVNYLTAKTNPSNSAK